MTYGIVVTDASGNSVFDSEDNPSNYQVVGTGYGTSVDVSSSTFGSGGIAKVFVRARSNIDISVERTGTNDEVYNFKRIVATEDGNTNVTSVTVTSQAVDYIVMKPMANCPVNTSIDDYGLQIFNSDSSIAFDSSRINTNSRFQLSGTSAPNTVNGDYNAFNTGVIFQYVNCEQFHYNVTASGGLTYGVRLAGVGSNRQTQFIFYTWTVTSGGGGGRGGGGGTPVYNTTYRNNPYVIEYGELLA